MSNGSSQNRDFDQHVQCVPDKRELQQKKKTKCAMCNQPYCKPRILPCRSLHTFCIYCLEYLVTVWPLVPDNDGGKPSVFCPECAEKVDLPEDGIESFMVNEYVLDVSDSSVQSPKRRVLQCLVCSSGNAVRWACVKCGTLLCDHCRYFHQRFAPQHCLHPVAPLRTDSSHGLRTHNTAPDAEKAGFCNDSDALESTTHCMLATLEGDYSQVKRDSSGESGGQWKEQQQPEENRQLSERNIQGEPSTQGSEKQSHLTLGRVVSENVLSTQRWPQENTKWNRTTSCPSGFPSQEVNRDTPEALPKKNVLRHAVLSDASLPLGHGQDSEQSVPQSSTPKKDNTRGPTYRPLPAKPIREECGGSGYCDSSDSEDYDEVVQEVGFLDLMNNSIPSFTSVSVGPKQRAVTPEHRDASSESREPRNYRLPKRTKSPDKSLASAGPKMIAGLLSEPVDSKIMWGKGYLATGLCVTKDKFILYGQKVQSRKRASYRMATFDAEGKMTQKIPLQSQITTMAAMEQQCLVLVDSSSCSLKITSLQRFVY